eukprot:TRINITY_DN5205_c0_g1_i2.p1 TRINITY_DN5205_c0_g1~~TRINITY_DN5205_c0_g1_i2.p1  ORF type:complete len:595 (-),score=67.36 TRINITY_DN5205_c0_g1_i2:5916-7700(-)
MLSVQMVQCRWYVFLVIVVSGVRLHAMLRETKEQVVLYENEELKYIEQPWKPTRTLLQGASDQDVVISIQEDVEVLLKVLYKNGTEEITTYSGPVAQFLALDEIQQISIIPTKEDEELGIEEDATSNTLILSSQSVIPSQIQPVESVQQLQDTPQPQPQQQSQIRTLPGLILDRPAGSEQQLYEQSQQQQQLGPYVVEQDQDMMQETNVTDFATLVDVNVDDRPVVDPDFGLPIYVSNISDATSSAFPTSTNNQPTLQRGLPNPFADLSPSAIPQFDSNTSLSQSLNSSSITSSPSQQSELQQYIYDQLDDLSLQLLVSPLLAPTTEENADEQQEETSNQSEGGFDAMIFSVANQNIQREDSMGSMILSEQEGQTQEDSYSDVVDVNVDSFQGQGQGQLYGGMGEVSVAYRVGQEGQLAVSGTGGEMNTRRCEQMEDLIKNSGGNLFIQAMKVANLDFDTIGDIIVVFLPDPVSFERQLMALGIDIVSSSDLSLTQLQQLRQLLLCYIVPDVLVLNLASIATPQSQPLITANQDALQLTAQGDQIYVSTLGSDNKISVDTEDQELARVGSTIPIVACQGFLFTLSNVLVPQNLA